LRAEGAPVLYEPAFEYGGVFVRVDILVSADNGDWDLYEVKSSTSLKPEHISDAAVQAYVLTGAGVAIDTVNVVTMNSSYVFAGGPYDLERLFRINDVTDLVRAWTVSVPGRLQRFQEMLDGDEPDIRIGSQCHNPYTCEFNEHCRRFLPAVHPVTELPGLSEAALHRFLDRGITSLLDVPDDYRPLSALQRETLQSVKTGEPVVDVAGLRADLAPLEWPVLHLDFETVSPALPLWPGTRPYEAIPFQYSIHVHEPGGPTDHHEHIHAGTGDPRRALAERLLADLDGGGSIVHYTSYEDRILAGLEAALPDLAPAISAVRDRLFDLYPVIRYRTKHPAAHGSASVKQVLPAWCPQMSYAHMAIADGQTAAARYLRTLKSLVDEESVRVITADLIRYCALDTLATVCLLEEMLKLAGTDQSPDSEPSSAPAAPTGSAS
jgi:predicted RecB family nuclease